MAKAIASDSIEQRQAELVMVAKLSRQLHLPLDRGSMRLPDGSAPIIDGVADQPFTLKLLSVEQSLNRRARKIHLFCDDEAASPFCHGGWRARALFSFGVEVLVVQVSESLRPCAGRARRRSCQWRGQWPFVLILAILVGCLKPDHPPTDEDVRGHQAPRGLPEENPDPGDGPAKKISQDAANKHLQRGVVRVDERRYEEALREFTAAIRLDPTPAAYSNRGLVHLRMGDKEAGMTDLNKAVEMDKTDPISLYNRAIGFADTAEPKKALADLDAAIAFDPTYADAFADRAALHRKLKQFKEAFADYRRAVELKPNEFIAHNGVAWMLATSPDPDIHNAKQALIHARRSHELSGGRWETADTVAAALARAGKFDEACSIQRSAIEDAPSDRHTELQARLRLYEAGRAYIEMED